MLIEWLLTIAIWFRMTQYSKVFLFQIFCIDEPSPTVSFCFAASIYFCSFLFLQIPRASYCLKINSFRVLLQSIHRLPYTSKLTSFALTLSFEGRFSFFTPLFFLSYFSIPSIILHSLQFLFKTNVLHRLTTDSIKAFFH